LDLKLQPALFVVKTITDASIGEAENTKGSYVTS